MFLLVVGLSAVCSQLYADEGDTVFGVETSNRGATFLFRVIPQGLTESCTFTIFGSPSRTGIQRNPTAQIEIGSEETTTDILEFRASNLRSLRRPRRNPRLRRKTFYFLVQTSCTSGAASSDVIRVRVRLRRTGIAKAKRWLRQFSSRISVGPPPELVDQFPALRFSQPVDLQNAGDGSNRLYVVEQAGTIEGFLNDPSTSTTTTLLDIEDQVVDGGERGLLGLAFHPNFSTNRYFYVNYTRNGSSGLETVISRFTASGASSPTADPSSELVLLTIEQPYGNHNAGGINFGPDGMLYIPLGDGGSGGDPDNNGQDRRTLLGSVLRIDVDNPDSGINYGIPPDNPFVGNSSGWREEIYAYGMRNPFQSSFDPVTGQYWSGDVGQDEREEVNIIVSGANYGWKIMEGTLCYSPSSGCDMTGLTLPVYDYPQSLGASVIGGYVYRGSELPQFEGIYIYGDFVSGLIWALDTSGASTTNTELFDSGFNLSDFGVDESNELYVVDYGGVIYRISAS